MRYTAEIIFQSENEPAPGCQKWHLAETRDPAGRWQVTSVEDEIQEFDDPGSAVLAAKAFAKDWPGSKVIGYDVRLQMPERFRASSERPEAVVSGRGQ